MWATTRRRDGARVKKGVIFLTLLLLALLCTVLLGHGIARHHLGDISNQTGFTGLSWSRYFYKRAGFSATTLYEDDNEHRFAKRADQGNVYGPPDEEEG